MKRNPYFARAHNNLGWALEASGRRQEAIAEYRTALELDKTLPQAWFNLAAAVEKIGEEQEARQAYQKAYQLLVEDPQFQENLQYQDFARRAQQAVHRLGGP